MRTVIKISNHLNSITQEHFLPSRRYISFKSSNDIVWKGSKRYAH
ncbi:hypothetical protein [Seonamhaeicola sp.]|nr:hypothetical protein [Seonamhaeicola sp.]